MRCSYKKTSLIRTPNFEWYRELNGTHRSEASFYLILGQNQASVKPSNPTWKGHQSTNPVFYNTGHTGVLPLAEFPNHSICSIHLTPTYYVSGTRLDAGGYNHEQDKVPVQLTF